MKKVKMIIATLMLATSFGSYAQMPENSTNPKLIAVVNRANWCGVCKANAERFSKVLMPYSAKGVNIYLNDLTNDSTKVASRQELEKANVYETVNTIPRKGMGKALKACHLVKDKKQTQDIAGIVTFIDPVSHKQLKQVSISVSDEEMNSIITKLLN
jgi:thiol-disulfide isomerase/thioredoxin